MTMPIWIYGAVPEPAGGVSVFLSRLIASGEIPIAGLIDPYFGEKISLDIPHWTPARAGLMARLNTMAKLFRIRAKPLFLNGSRPAMMMAIAPFLVCRRAPTYLMLHHGNLGKVFKLSRIRRTALRLSARRFARIACLSETQRSFFLDLGVSEHKLWLVDSYFQPKSPSEGNLFPEAQAIIDWIKKGSGPVIIGSGYAVDYYRHEWALDAIEQDPGLSDARYVLCCYGPENAYVQKLCDRFADTDRARFVFGLNPGDFDHVLSLASVYVRPSDVDSFGIALHDAANMGIAIVASDVCERPAGALVHQVGNHPEFRLMLGVAMRSDVRPNSPDPRDRRAKVSQFLDSSNQRFGRD